MARILKWVGIVLGGLIGVCVVAAAVLFFLGGSRLSRRYDVQVTRIALPTDDSAIARGRHLVEAVALCVGCHGEDLSGDVLIDEPMIATVYASNLTAGRGGVGATLTDTDFVRAIRHGVNPDGRGLMIMHADAYHHLTEEDLGAIIAYVRSVPPVDHEVPATRGGLLGKVLVPLGAFDTETMPLIPAEVIDHEAPITHTPLPAVTAQYGEYLVSIALCPTCHGRQFTGGPPIEEGAPPPPNIRAYGVPGGLTEEQFITTIRTGVTPYGKGLNPDAMPWKVYQKMTDDELRAIRLRLAVVAAADSAVP